VQVHSEQGYAPQTEKPLNEECTTQSDVCNMTATVESVGLDAGTDE